jgi:OPA family glycerol-3-phosphate transporter-like MFS transporter
MISKLLASFKPAAHIARLPEELRAARYKALRWQMMLSIFFGYAGFYLVRKNFSLAKPYLINHYGFSKGDVGLIATALAVSYGLSKFVMGNVSDRSNPRYFMATGLILSGAINLLFPTLAGSLWAMAALWFVAGAGMAGRRAHPDTLVLRRRARHQVRGLEPGP